MNKADRLLIAGAIAPVLRDKPSRRIKTIGHAGNVIREVTDTEVTLAILKRASIEFDVTDQKRSQYCNVCGARLCGSKTDRRSTRAVRQRAPRGKHGKCRSCFMKALRIVQKAQKAQKPPQKRGPQPTNPWRGNL